MIFLIKDIKVRNGDTFMDAYFKNYLKYVLIRFVII